MNERIEKAESAHNEARRELAETVRKEYPVGCIVLVKTNTVAGEKLHQILVDGHGNEWHEPSYLRGTNLATGKRRNVHASYVVGKEPLDDD